jgi:glycosyltransferase involved in cell wall biosynthesis
VLLAENRSHLNPDWWHTNYKFLTIIKPLPPNRMQVLHIITDFNDGGAQAVLYRFITADRQNTHQVISLMGIGWYGERSIELGFQVHSLDMPKGKITLDGITKLYKLIRKIDPDLIQTWMYHSDLIGSTIARLAGKKAIVWGIHNSNLDPAKTALTTRLIARGCAIISGSVPQKIISCSNDGVKIHSELGYQSQKMVVVPNGYDISEFSPQPDLRNALRQQLQIPEDTTLIGTIARWNPQKDHPNLIAALGQLQTRSQLPWHCLLVGSFLDQDNQELGSLLAKYGVENRVTLLGIRSDIAAVMNALDLHVLPSAYGEAFPNVVSEAMACGTPCIVTDVGDAGLIVGDAGWVVPPRDPEQLATAMLTAINEKSNPTSWKARQAICRARIENNFNLQIMIEKYNHVWKEAILSASK